MTAADLLRMAYGELSLSLEQFEVAEPEWFRYAVEGKRREEDRRDRAAMERTRWLAALLLSPHSRRPLKVTDLLEFPEETEARIAEMKALSKEMNEDPRFPKRQIKNR